MSGGRIIITGEMMVARLSMMNGMITRMGEETMPRILEGSRITRVGVTRETTTITTTKVEKTREDGATMMISSRTTTMGIHGSLTVEITTIRMMGRTTTMGADGVPKIGRITTIKEETRDGRQLM
jgi:hypothetical protein